MQVSVIADGPTWPLFPASPSTPPLLARLCRLDPPRALWSPAPAWYMDPLAPPLHVDQLFAPWLLASWLHMGPSSLRLHLSHSSHCLCHGLLGHWLCLITLRLHWASHSLRLLLSTPAPWFHLGRSLPWLGLGLQVLRWHPISFVSLALPRSPTLLSPPLSVGFLTPPWLLPPSVTPWVLALAVL